MKIIAFFFIFHLFITSNLSSQFKIEIIQGLSGYTMNVINENDIVCIDWQHQSIKLKQNTIDKIDRLPLLASAQYYLSISLHAKELYRVYVSSMYAACSVPKDSAYVIFKNKPNYTIFDRGWLVIRYHNDNQYKNHILSNLLLQRYLYKTEIPAGYYWQCVSKLNTTNKILSYERIKKDFNQKFKIDYDAF